MQKKKEQYNRKQSNKIQNLSAKTSTKAPQNNVLQKTRAKYECNKELTEMIQQANLVKNIQKFSSDYESGNIRKGIPTHISWLEFLLSLPKEVQYFVFGSEERRKYEKEDGYEYWINNDGEAQDKLIDLNNGNEISDEVFNRIINSGADEIANFLVYFGYFGDEYSYSKQQKKERKAKFSYSSFEYEYGDEDENYENNKIFEVVVYMNALERLHNIRDFLLSIINLSKNLEIVPTPSDENSYHSRRNKENFTQSAIRELTAKKLKDKVLATTININEKGEISFSISEWASALQGVEITRIRLCEVCEDIFWANRRDAFACSPKHAKTRQMRLLRANWKEKENLYLKARQKKERTKKEN